MSSINIVKLYYGVSICSTPPVYAITAPFVVSLTKAKSRCDIVLASPQLWTPPPQIIATRTVIVRIDDGRKYYGKCKFYSNSELFLSVTSICQKDGFLMQCKV